MPRESQLGAVSLRSRERNVVIRRRRRGIIAHRLQHLARHALPPQLGLDEASPAGAVAVSLLGPPASEGHVVDIPEMSQALDRGGNHVVVRASSAKPALELPARARPCAQEVSRDLHRGIGIGSRSLGRCFVAPPASGHRCPAGRDYSASEIPSTPISMEETLPRISASILSASSG